MMTVVRMLLVVMVCAFSLFSISCQKSSLKQNKQYSGYVAVEKLARYLTSDKKDQDLVVNFLSNMKENFHIDPHVLFQNSDYLTVVIQKVGKGELLHLYFTNREPIIRRGLIFFDGYLSYSYSYTCTVSGKFIQFQSWYEGPSKYGDWSSGRGFDYQTLIKTINLSDRQQFDWYQPPKQP